MNATTNKPETMTAWDMARLPHESRLDGLWVRTADGREWEWDDHLRVWVRVK